MIYPVDFDDRITKNTPTTWSVFGAERFDKNTEDSYRYKKLIVFIYLCVTPVSKEVKICCSLELTELRPLPIVYQLFNVVSPQSRFSWQFEVNSLLIRRPFDTNQKLFSFNFTPNSNFNKQIFFHVCDATRHSVVSKKVQPPTLGAKPPTCMTKGLLILRKLI